MDRVPAIFKRCLPKGLCSFQRGEKHSGLQQSKKCSSPTSDYREWNWLMVPAAALWNPTRPFVPKSHFPLASDWAWLKYYGRPVPQRQTVLWCAALAWRLPICLAAVLLELRYALRLSLHNFLLFFLSIIGIEPTSKSENSTNIFWLSVLLIDNFPHTQKWLAHVNLSNICFSKNPN